MTELFCEDPTYLYVTVVIVELLMLFIYYKLRDRKLALSLLIPVVICGVTFALDYFIVTDREQITAITQEIADAAVKGSLKPATDYLDESYVGYAGDKTQLIVLTEEHLKQLKLTSCKLTDFDIKITGKQADMTVISTLKSQEHGGVYCLKWKVYWVKTHNGWRIRSAEEPRQTVPGFGIN